MILLQVAHSNCSPTEEVNKPPSEIRKLAAAIILRATMDYFLTPQNPAQVYWKRNAKIWFKSDNYYYGSLDWCCEVLSIRKSKILDHIKNKNYKDMRGAFSFNL